MATTIKKGGYAMVRGDGSGVFAGTLKKRKGQEVTLTKARRIWWWEGAASLSQLAQSGTTKPDKCKFPEEVDEVLVLDCVEIIAITAKAKKSIKNVAVWKA